MLFGPNQNQEDAEKKEEQERQDLLNQQQKKLATLRQRVEIDCLSFDESEIDDVQMQEELDLDIDDEN